MLTDNSAMAKRSSPPERDVERSVLDNGVRVVTEQAPGAAKAVIGLWVDAGSRFEEPNESGSTNLIQRLALQSKDVESVNGWASDVRLETGRDYASYSAEVESGAAEAALELLTNLALRPSLETADMAPECEKVLGELRAAEHDPDFVLERMFLRSLWKGHGLCRPPRGRLLTVKNETKLLDFKLKKLAKYHQMSHHPEALVLIGAGAVEHEELQNLAIRILGELTKPKKTLATTPPAEQRFVAIKNRPQFGGVRIRLGFPTCSESDDLMPAAGVLNALIEARLESLKNAGDLSALEVSTKIEAFADAGCIVVSLRANLSDAQAAYERVVTELRALSLGEVEADEIERARATLPARISAQLDSPRARAESLAKHERYYGRLVPLSEQLEKLNSVSAEAVTRLASRWIQPYTLSVAALGSLQGLSIKPPTSCW